MSKMRYRLALDLGTTSIGWAMLRLSNDQEASPHPVAIIKCGVRIFGDGRDPKGGSSLAVDRRLARGMRRNRDRKLKRKQRLMETLVDSGLMPMDRVERRALTQLDPYALRARGLEEELTPFEFGRAIFHLNQRRGFKSNRKTDSPEAEGSLLKGTIAKLREKLEADGYETVGQWLAERHANRQSVRARLRGSTVKDKAYDLYMDRSMIDHEFEKLWRAQHGFNPAFYSTEKYEAITDTIFFQRDLLPVRAGRCTLEPELERAPKALPSSQLFRMYQEVNNLSIEVSPFTYRSLTLSERDVIADRLNTKKANSFDALRKALKLEGGPRFNLESEKRKDLKGNVTAIELSKPDCFGDQWKVLTLEVQDQIVTQILEETDEEKLIAWLTENHNVSDDNAKNISESRNALTKMSSGYANLSNTAIHKIMPHLISDVRKYSDAVVAAGYKSHSGLTHMEQTGEILSELPYYGEYLQRHVGHGTGIKTDLPAIRFGRIANPTVHIALNELAKVVNALISQYGAPEHITVELARDLKKTQEQKKEETKEQSLRQKENEFYSQQIYEATGITASRKDLQKMRLWVELNKHDPTGRRCIYTGEMISINRLFSPEVEVEHILPFSRTLDDSLNNKTVSMVRANRDKGNKTPYEAFGSSPEGYDYAAIVERARNSSSHRAKRFAPDGYEKWLREDADFLARALSDTAYLSRIAREYLQLITPEPVTVVPGRMTASLRRHWGLNNLLSEDGEKNRMDHRHHAVDAIVVGLMDRGSLAKYAKAQGRGKDIREQLERTPHEEPLKDLRMKAQRAVNAIKVSHRPNHSHERQMNNDTNYGFRPNGFVSQRKALDNFDSAKAIKNAHFADKYLQEKILRFVGDSESTEFTALIADYSNNHGTRKARIWEKLNAIPIPLNKNARHRAPKGIKTREDNSPRGVKGDSNYCIEISINEKNKWVGEVVTTYEAYRIVREQGNARLRDSHSTQSEKPLVIRLMRDDVLEVDIEGTEDRKLMRVCQFSSNGRLNLAEITEANVDARVRTKEIKYLSATAGTLQSRNAKKVTISPDGRVSKRNL